MRAQVQPAECEQMCHLAKSLFFWQKMSSLVRVLFGAFASSHRHEYISDSIRNLHCDLGRHIFRGGVGVATVVEVKNRAPDD